MTDKEKRQMRQRAEDAMFNRMLLCLLGVVIAEAVILLVKRFYIEVPGGETALAVSLAMMHFFSIYNFAGVILSVLGCVWSIRAKRQNKSVRLPVVCTVILTALWIISVLAYCFNETGVKLLVALPFVAALLILVYFLYQRAFFVGTVICGFGIAGLWCLRQAQNTFVTICFVIGWILLVAISALAYVLKKNGGKLGKFKLVNDQKSYQTCWITCAVVMIATLLGFIMGAGVAYYLLYALVGWLFCMAVYFTVKMM